MPEETKQADAALAGVNRAELLAVEFLQKLIKHMEGFTWEVREVTGKPDTFKTGSVRQASRLFGHTYIDQIENSFGSHGTIWVPIGSDEENYLRIRFCS